MIAYLQLRLVQLNYPGRLSLQQIARKIDLNLMTKRSLVDLLSNTPGKSIAPALIAQGFLELQNV
ncbi:hypothetical protein [Endozoicomonas atrinae]|nr:hypothetical protein [Endozoicomonas atrinae]